MRLRHKQTGVLATVSDERAGRLGSEWEQEKPVKAKPAPAPRRRKSSDSDDD